ncbi:hypothetical protein QO003_001795 [Arthrobacter silviterrae]|nr:hypothetical protein [Arthrobacter silviterrae]
MNQDGFYASRHLPSSQPTTDFREQNIHVHMRDVITRGHQRRPVRLSRPDTHHSTTLARRAAA